MLIKTEMEAMMNGMNLKTGVMANGMPLKFSQILIKMVFGMVKTKLMMKVLIP